jgi:carbonic anhydrase
MKKVFHFDTPREQYAADAAVVMCFDLRFNLAFHKFLKRIGAPNYDLIKVAGGAKCLASPDSQSEREFVLDQVRKSVQLHRTTRVVLMVHSDCGAYGGSAAFDNDAAAEASHHESELRQAALLLREAIPDLTVEAYFVDFEGVWAVDAPVAGLATLSGARR